MAIKLASDREALAIAHEMNVTPFIDVMLVLLIIFMVAAPLATVDVGVELPSSSATPTPRADRPVVLMLPIAGEMRLDGQTVETAALRNALVRATGGDRDARIHVQADRRVPYERLMATMDALHAAGYRRIALVGLEAATAP
ncbi:TonB system transport protein ExbD [Silanimonas algicola]